MRIVFTGGGTAGHIFPLLSIIRELKKISLIKKEVEIFYIGPDDGYPLELLAKEGVKVKKIICGKLRRYFSPKTILDFLKIPIGTIQAFFWLFVLAPEFVFSKGGYGSFPAVFCAKLLRIPIFLHESDVVPGLASKIEGRWAVEIFTSFENTSYFPKEKMVCVGNPIREEILGGDKEKAKEIFKIKTNNPVLLILGGSQGSKKINETIMEILQELLFTFEVIHQTGSKSFYQIKAEAEVILDKTLMERYHIYPFLKEEELKNALAACDIVVSRAGAGAIFEISAAGKPAILIPFAYASQNHQVKNAYEFEKNGAGEVIEEENLTPHFLLEKLKYLIARPDILEQMTLSSKKFAKKEAGKIIAFYLAEYLYQVKKARELSKKKEKKKNKQEKPNKFKLTHSGKSGKI